MMDENDVVSPPEGWPENCVFPQPWPDGVIPRSVTAGYSYPPYWPRWLGWLREKRREATRRWQRFRDRYWNLFWDIL